MVQWQTPPIPALLQAEAGDCCEFKASLNSILSPVNSEWQGCIVRLLKNKTTTTKLSQDWRNSVPLPHCLPGHLWRGNISALSLSSPLCETTVGRHNSLTSSLLTRFNVTVEGKVSCLAIVSSLTRSLTPLTKPHSVLQVLPQEEQ